MIDSNPEIGSCVGEYIDGTSEKKLIIEPYHEDDEQPTPTAIRNQKIVSAALRNMNPDPANDENALRATIRDILFSRFHGQSVLEEDYSDPATGQLNRLKVNGVGSIIGMLMLGGLASATINPAIASTFQVNGVTVSLAGGLQQFGNQAIGVLFTAVFAGGVTFILLKIVDAVVGLRVDIEDESTGLDLSQHGERAYSE